MDDRMPQNAWLLPLAIVVAGIIVAFAIFNLRMNHVIGPAKGDVSVIRAIDENDHIIGKPDAPVVVIEYSDIDCEYCKEFHTAMQQIMSEYGPTGKVAWVYRHFPLANPGSSGELHAEAAECAAAAGGTDMFWRFIDALNAAAPGSRTFDPTEYGSIVDGLGIPRAAFDECVTARRYNDRVAADLANALSAGGTGAPFTVLLIQGSGLIPISGALPYPAMKQVIETALQKAATNP